MNSRSKRKVWTKILVIFLAFIFMVSSGVALFSRSARSADAITKYPLNIKDALGYALSFKKEPMRIISLNPATTEMVFAAGFGSKLVGVTTYCDYPEEAKKISKIGDMNVNIESIIALKPDLIIGMQDLQPDTLSRLRSLGLNVLIIDATSSDKIIKCIDTIGVVCGNDLLAAKVIQDIEKRLNTVKKAVSGKKTPRVFVEIWNSPLMSAGKGAFIDEIITLAGGKNIAGSLSAWPVVSDEFVIASNPEIILLTCFNKTEVMARKTWQSISAVSTNQVYEVNTDIASRNGPRFIEAVEMYAKIFHPGALK